VGKNSLLWQCRAFTFVGGAIIVSRQLTGDRTNFFRRIAHPTARPNSLILFILSSKRRRSVAVRRKTHPSRERNQVKFRLNPEAVSRRRKKNNNLISRKDKWSAQRWQTLRSGQCDYVCVCRGESGPIFQREECVVCECVRVRFGGSEYFGIPSSQSVPYSLSCAQVIPEVHVSLEFSASVLAMEPPHGFGLWMLCIISGWPGGMSQRCLLTLRKPLYLILLDFDVEADVFFHYFFYILQRQGK
jgi:hypothetical protein